MKFKNAVCSMFKNMQDLKILKRMGKVAFWIQIGPVAHCLQSRTQVLKELVELVPAKEKFHESFRLNNGEIGDLTARQAKMVLFTRADRRSVRAPGLWRRGSLIGKQRLQYRRSIVLEGNLV